MFLTVNRLMALSLGTQREQFEQRTGLTWPRPFLLRPLFLRFFVYGTKGLVSVDDQAHPSTIVASIVEPIHNRPLRYETYNETIARTDCEGEMLTIVGGEKDGGWLSG